MTSAEQKAMALAVDEAINAVDELHKQYHSIGTLTVMPKLKALRAALGEQPAPSVGDEERARDLLHDIEDDCFIHGYGGDCIDHIKALPVIAKSFAAIRSESALSASETADEVGMKSAEEWADEFLANTYGIVSENEWRKELIAFLNNILAPQPAPKADDNGKFFGEEQG